MQVALPGFAPDPYRLEPIRPSYTKMCRQLEAVARTASKPVATLTAVDVVAHAQRCNWSQATVRTLTRVAHAHGLDIDPATNPRPRSRPAHLLLSQLLVTSPAHPPAQQRSASLAALCWHVAAPLAWWRKLTFADLAFVGGDVILAGFRCRNTRDTVAVWAATARTNHLRPDDRLALLSRLDDSPSAAGERAIELGFAEHMAGITFDRWRAWAVDAGAVAIERGLDRHRHR